MIIYKTFRPTQYDIHIEVEGQEEWLVGPCVHNRDSDIATEANWKAFNQIMWEARQVDAEDADYEVHRFGHWGNGWFEIVLIKPGSKAAEEAQKCEDTLENNSILDDNIHSDMENEEVAKYWDTMSLRERVDVCKKTKTSIFAARRENFNGDIYDYLRDRL